ncbi:hypothetical protein PHYBLDRAFT_145728 [Phycomyces blakesleeanus NRRL 1555(-)]|uniref:Uncharacterized protein n=1 Tax=Phycomyces blakesleeanus (strain ATCC 8743b / DSM 1359 / FGSC 10004 / NBRC 33097 / NRRL 1555) TaxID=763407 RepID=A0A162U4C2_PHYB8|nr:hypothetical protein PHYBLDRAFT_145728 [Phycomyces blakesleeanus NRRL 1555(-)]OAD73332.1 hypothetical protein PHYBLDRAFT_145728 [Phycomyces blakesleeanus NRRL 1555(-)]|eukprot:XP_018291372.1 hypothetical protein PHYBLDRAFT_145728 [Phycomyces blakesleeanus NRRL 1555(-)]
MQLLITWHRCCMLPAKVDASSRPILRHSRCITTFKYSTSPKILGGVEIRVLNGSAAKALDLMTIFPPARIRLRLPKAQKQLQIVTLPFPHLVPPMMFSSLTLSPTFLIALAPLSLPSTTNPTIFFKEALKPRKRDHPDPPLGSDNIVSSTLLTMHLMVDRLMPTTKEIWIAP